jgi:hypothetical protein
VSKGLKKLHSKEFRNLHCSPIVIRMRLGRPYRVHGGDAKYFRNYG